MSKKEMEERVGDMENLHRICNVCGRIEHLLVGIIAADPTGNYGGAPFVHIDCLPGSKFDRREKDIKK